MGGIISAVLVYFSSLFPPSLSRVREDREMRCAWCEETSPDLSRVPPCLWAGGVQDRVGGRGGAGTADRPGWRLLRTLHRSSIPFSVSLCLPNTYLCSWFAHGGNVPLLITKDVKKNGPLWIIDYNDGSNLQSQWGLHTYSKKINGQMNQSIYKLLNK